MQDTMHEEKGENSSEGRGDLVRSSQATRFCVEKVPPGLKLTEMGQRVLMVF